MTMIDLTPRLRTAADYLHKVGWTTGTERDNKGQVCLTGAVRFCAPQNGDEYLIREVLRRRDRAENWNDNVATAEQVEDYLRTAEITDADLKETFGPQWLQIVQLVRAASGMTGTQVNAAGDAAWYAARPDAGDAAGDAAGGLAIRDLIGQYGFTQEHYDTLTGPWRRVVGKIHPDDADLS